MSLQHKVVPAAISGLLGLTLALQMRTMTQQQQTAAPMLDQESALVHMLQVNKERDRLQEELRNLKDLASKQATQDRLQGELQEERAAAGLAPLRGPGVTVAMANARLAGTMAVEEVLLVINELRVSGAEGMAINGVRVTERIRITAAPGGGIAINGTPVRGQLLIEAVGDPRVLAAGLNLPGGVVQYLNTTRYPVSVMEVTDVLVPQAPELSYSFGRASR